MESFKATFAGMICGALFTVLKLPIPAPPVLSGIMGIIGVWLGHVQPSARLSICCTPLSL